MISDELKAVVELAGKATAGEWYAPVSEGGASTHPEGPVALLQGPRVRMLDKMQGMPPEDAAAIAAAVNFLRAHGPELLAALENDRRYRWLRSGDNDEEVMRTYADTPNRIGGARPFDPRFDNSFLLRNEALDAAIDTALSAAGGVRREGG